MPSCCGNNVFCSSVDQISTYVVAAAGAPFRPPSKAKDGKAKNPQPEAEVSQRHLEMLAGICNIFHDLHCFSAHALRTASLGHKKSFPSLTSLDLPFRGGLPAPSQCQLSRVFFGPAGMHGRQVQRLA